MYTARRYQVEYTVILTPLFVSGMLEASYSYIFPRCRHPTVKWVNFGSCVRLTKRIAMRFPFSTPISDVAGTYYPNTQHTFFKFRSAIGSMQRLPHAIWTSG